MYGEDNYTYTCAEYLQTQLTSISVDLIGEQHTYYANQFSESVTKKYFTLVRLAGFFTKFLRFESVAIASTTTVMKMFTLLCNRVEEISRKSSPACTNNLWERTHSSWRRRNMKINCHHSASWSISFNGGNGRHPLQMLHSVRTLWYTNSFAFDNFADSTITTNFEITWIGWSSYNNKYNYWWKII